MKVARKGVVPRKVAHEGGRCHLRRTSPNPRVVARSELKVLFVPFDDLVRFGQHDLVAVLLQVLDSWKAPDALELIHSRKAGAGDARQGGQHEEQDRGNEVRLVGAPRPTPRPLADGSLSSPLAVPLARA